MPKCTPEQLHQLADYLTSRNIGEVKVQIEKFDSPPLAADPVTAESRRKLGHAWFIRTQRGALGPEFAARIHNKTNIIVNKFESFRFANNKKFSDALESMGITGVKKIRGLLTRQDEDLFKAVTNMDETGHFNGPVASINPKTLETARQVRAIMEEVGRANQIRASKYLEYRRMIHENGGQGPILRQDTPPIRQFTMDMSVEEGKFFSELERRNVVRDWDSRATAMFKDYISTVGSKRILTPELNKLEAEEVYPFFGVRHTQSAQGLGTMVHDKTGWDMWRELRSHIYGQPTEMDKMLTIALQRGADSLGVSIRNKLGVNEPLSEKSTYGIVQMISHLFHAGVLSSPGSAIRQAFQLVNVFAELGVRPTVAGFQALAEPRDYYRKLVARGILSPQSQAISEQVGVARMAGRVIGNISETALLLFETADRAMRLVAARGAEFKFNEALFGRGIENLQAGREIKDQVLKLVSQGRTDEARDLYMMHVVGETQGIFGRANRPAVMRGAVGQALGMLQGYPLNLFEMYNYMGKRAIRGIKGGVFGIGDEPLSEALPLFRQLFLVGGIMMGGKEAFGVDLSSNFLSFPGALPALEAVGATVGMARTNVEWMWGNAFQLGETDFHKRLRTEADHEFARQSLNFVPLGLAIKKAKKVYDEPTFREVMKQLGFPPLAEDINIEVRAKAAETRRAKRAEKMLNPPPAL